MSENKKLSCAVARDLMPLYVENLTEEETTVLMREHISECAACAQSYGMQKTKLEIEKKPQRPDFRGVRFFKKSFLKRVALWMAVAIMSFVIAAAGYAYVFDYRDVDVKDISIVGQYELSDGRIVIALRADGYCVNELDYHFNTFADQSYYEFVDGVRLVKDSDVLEMRANIWLYTNRFSEWTRKDDGRGDVFYYLFDPDAQAEYAYNSWAFATPAPTTESEPEEKNETVALQSLQVNDRRIWAQGDPLRKLTAEEEEVLLRAMEKAGFLESSALLPEVDIIDTLMGK